MTSVKDSTGSDLDQNTNGDQHMADPSQRWVFDAEVTKNFEAMLSASIPGYREMRHWTTVMAQRALDVHYRDGLLRGNVNGGRPPLVMDIGASRGEAVEPLVSKYWATDAPPTFCLVEVSQPMMEVLEVKFGTNPMVQLVCSDISEDVGWMAQLRPSLVMSILTLMFIPLECRARVIQSVHDCMRPGGTFLVVEKTLGDSADSQEMLVDTYHRFKMDQGYSQEAVERKRMSLKGSLMPIQAGWTECLLREAGFVHIQQYWRALQFVGWSCQKPTHG